MTRKPDYARRLIMCVVVWTLVSIIAVVIDISFKVPLMLIVLPIPVMLLAASILIIKEDWNNI